MFSGRKKSLFAIVHPLESRKRKILYSYRVCQVLVSALILALWYATVSDSGRMDVVTETCYPAVLFCLFFRVLTSPVAEISFFYHLYVNSIGIGLYSIVGTLDLYHGLVERPAPENSYAHYARLYLMLAASILLVADTIYVEFFEANLRILPEKTSVGDAARIKIEAAMKRYEEALAKKGLAAAGPSQK